MARGRMISASIGESRKFAALESDLHRLIYLMVLPHVDKAGRFEADSIIIRAKCLTRLDVDATTVEAWLKDAARTNLLRVYEAAGIRVLEIVDFLKHNSPHHKEPESDLPPPESGTPCYTQETMDEPSMGQARAEHEPSKAIREVKEREVKGKEREHPPTPLAALEPLASPDVEAAPRLSLEPEPPPSTGKKPKPKPRKAVEHEFNPVVVAGELPPQFDPDRFLAFCGMRLKRGWPMTLEALKAFLRKHQKHPRAVLDEMFDNAIVGQWQDLYPLKHDRPTGSARASPARDLPTAADFEHVPTNAELLGLTGGEPN